MNPTDDSHQISQLPHPRTSPQLEGDDQGGGEEWGSEEKRLFDSAQAELDPNCPDLFQKIQWRVPGKTIEEIKRHYDLVNNLVEENLHHPPQQPPRNRRVLSGEKPPISDPNPHFPQWGPWTWREHELFLMGLIRYGTGDWKRISRDFVYTRTPKQVGHHAQAYLKRPYRLGDRIRRHELAASKFRTSQPVDAVKSAPSSSEPVSTVLPEILMGGKCLGGRSEGKAIVHQPPPLTTLELFPVTHSTAAPIPSQPSVGCFTIGLPVGAEPSTYARRYGAHPALGLPIGVRAGPSTSVARASAGFSAGELSLGLPIGSSSNTIGVPAGASTAAGFSMSEDLPLGLPIGSSSDSDFTIAVPAARPPPSVARALSAGFRGGNLSFGFSIASSTIDGDFTIGLPVGSSTQSRSHAASSPVGELSLGLPVGSSVNGDITLGLPASGTSMGARTSAAVSGGELTSGNSAGQDSMIGGPVLSSSTVGMAAGFHMGTPIVSSSDSQTSNTLSTEGMAVGWPVGIYLNFETSGAFLLDSLTLNTFINAQTAVTTPPPYGFSVGLPVGSSTNTHNSRAFSPTDFTVGFLPNTQAIRVSSPSGFSTIGWPASIPSPHPISNFTIGTPIGYRVNPQTRAFSLDHFVIGIPVTTVNFQSFGASPSDFSSGFPIADSMSTSTSQSYRASSPCTDDSTIGLPVEENFYFTMGLPVSPPINQQTLDAPSPNILTTGVPISTSPDTHTSSSTASSLSDFAIGLAIGTPIHAQNSGDSSSSLSDLDELSSLRTRRRGRG